MTDEKKTDEVPVVAEPTSPPKSNAQIRYEAWCKVHDAGQMHNFGHPSWDKTPQLVKDAWVAADAAIPSGPVEPAKGLPDDSNKSPEISKSESPVQENAPELNPPPFKPSIPTK